MINNKTNDNRKTERQYYEKLSNQFKLDYRQLQLQATRKCLIACV